MAVAEALSINISLEFTDAVGARKFNDGAASGEKFLTELLRPRFEQALQEKTTLFIDLDGNEGYPTSFLEEAFGGLARLFGARTVLKSLEFKSEDEPLLIEEIQNYIKEAKK